MHVINLTIDSLLNIQNEQLLIPVYQRRYSWGEKQHNELFNDVYTLKGEGQNQEVHHFGMVVIHNREGNPGHLIRLDVIDGQQRITTLQLLLKSLAKVYSAKVNLDPAGIQFRFLSSIRNLISIYDRATNRQLPKLRLGNMDQHDFEIIMSDGDLNQVSNVKLKSAINYFDEKLNELAQRGDEYLDDFAHKLIYRTYLVKITFTNIEDAFKQFEYINDRGLPLSETDKIKNFLLGHAARLNEDVLGQINQTWSDAIANIDSINQKPDDFFRRYFCSLLRSKVSNNNLNKDFKKYFIQNILDQEVPVIEARDEEGDDDERDEDVFVQIPQDIVNPTLSQNMVNLVHEILSSSEAYKRLAQCNFGNEALRMEVENLNYIECAPSYIFLLQFIQKDVNINVKKNVIKIISSLALRRQICKERTGETDQIFSKLVRVLDYIGEDNFVFRLKEAILNQGKYPSDNKFKDELLTYDFKNAKNRARVLLEHHNRVLLNNAQGNPELRILGPMEVNIEHIIPQSISEDNANGQIWQEYLGPNAIQNHKRNIWKIGNLTLLSGEINKEAQNSPWSVKRELYRRSTLDITRSLSDLPDFKFQQVDMRSELIAESVVTNWRIEL